MLLQFVCSRKSDEKWGVLNPKTRPLLRKVAVLTLCILRELCAMLESGYQMVYEHGFVAQFERGACGLSAEWVE